MNLTQAAGPVDTDADGMPDDYEDATPGLNKDFAADAAQGADDGLFDNDGLTNLEEYNFGTDPNVADVDADDLNDGGEFAAGTDPFVADSDTDGLNDGAEVHGTFNPYHVGHVAGDLPGGTPGAPSNPLEPDSDFDGLSDFTELDNGNGSVTDPNSFDTDGDFLEDEYEVTYGLDPTDATGLNGESGDPDLDGLTNGEEQTEGTDPRESDTDSDGLSDLEELDGTLNPYHLGHIPGDPPAGNPPSGAPTKPLDDDSDDDGLLDGAEVNNANGSVTDPNDSDTDLDTLLDGFEVAGGLDPRDDTGDNGATGDPDGDTVVNADEQFYGSHPNDGDTDGDTLTDDVEIFTHFTNPARADTDGDLIRDDEELVEGADGFVTDPLEGDTDFDTFKDHIEVEAGSNPELDTSTPTFPAISWSAEDFDEETDLSTEGTLLFADNYQGDDLTLNGISFVGRKSADDNKSTPNTQTLLDTNSDQVSAVNLAGFYDGEVPALTPLVTTFWFEGDPLAVNFGLTGLTPGKTYLVQVGRVDDRGATIVDRYMLADGFGGDSALDPVGPTNTIYGGPDNPALLFTGTFTAAFTVQTFLWEQFLADGTLLGSHIPFLQVREIEPTAEITITDVRRIGTTFEVDFAGLDPAESYQLVRSADLQDGFPTVVDGPRAPAGAADTFTDPNATDSKAFYQLEQMP